MPYQDVKKNLIEPARNPYNSSGSAMSILSDGNVPAIVHTEFIKELLEEVKGSLRRGTPIKLFLVGQYGYGKTTSLNLIAEEFRAKQGICVPVKFQEIVTPVAASTHPDNYFESVLGAILTKMYHALVKEGLLTKQDAVIFDEIEYIDIFDGIFKMLERTHKHNILIAFDELEALFGTLQLKIGYILSFLHSLSEKLAAKPGWGLCVSVTEEYYSEIISEARQLPEARFNFKFINQLLFSEVKEYIEAKNSSVTLKTIDKVYPFEDEVIEFISTVSGGIPRYVETICQLLWAEAEPSYESVSIETARKIFSNSYRTYASAYFSELRNNVPLSDESQAFLNVLFFSGGRRQSIQELLVLKDYCPISYFDRLSDDQAKYRLKIASEELRSNSKLEDILEVFGRRPYRYTLTNTAFKDIFSFRERL
jgi:hypothetical protein